MTVAHLRTYTINKGMMDDWLETFKNVTVWMAKAGIKVESTWVNEQRNQFIWIRSYGDKVENIATAEATFYGSDEWLANVDHVRSHIAHVAIVQIETV
ncbi:NIPSNAP family protein [Dehalococcoides mccartyi]|nr:NIPSNAP family protein [Dehalococcoides mccartyi]